MPCRPVFLCGLGYTFAWMVQLAHVIYVPKKKGLVYRIYQISLNSNARTLLHDFETKQQTFFVHCILSPHFQVCVSQRNILKFDKPNFFYG